MKRILNARHPRCRETELLKSDNVAKISSALERITVVNCIILPAASLHASECKIFCGCRPSFSKFCAALRPLGLVRLVDSKLCQKRVYCYRYKSTRHSFFRVSSSSDCGGGPVEKKVEANGSEGALFSRVTVTS